MIKLLAENKLLKKRYQIEIDDSGKVYCQEDKVQTSFQREFGFYLNMALSQQTNKIGWALWKMTNEKDSYLNRAWTIVEMEDDFDATKLKPLDPNAIY